MSVTYNSYAFTFPMFQPGMRLITAITQANPAVVTTSFAHQYSTGLVVRLDIPQACGMQQANQQTGMIVVTSPTTFAININTTTYDPFSIPSLSNPAINIAPQVVPIGEVSQTVALATVNVLPYSAT